MGENEKVGLRICMYLSTPVVLSVVAAVVAPGPVVAPVVANKNQCINSTIFP